MRLPKKRTLLDCASCHYYNANPTSAGNTGHFDPLDGSHNTHFVATKKCAQCHAIPVDSTHINGSTSLNDAAAALQDEALVSFGEITALTDYTIDGNNICTNTTNDGLGCHATGAPDWDVPFASTACTNCHTNTTDTAVNPTSCLHATGSANMLSANPHDANCDIDGGDGSGTGDCVTCHTATPSSAHTNGSFNATIGALGNSAINFEAAVNYTDAVAPTCGPTGALATCHGSTANSGDAGQWKRLWSATADDASSANCANCHGGFGANDWAFGTIG